MPTVQVLHSFLDRALRRERDILLLMRGRQQAPLRHWIVYVRWAIPVTVALIGIGYVLVDQVWSQGQSLSSPLVVRAVIVLGIANPLIIALILTWATKIEGAWIAEQANRRALHV